MASRADLQLIAAGMAVLLVIAFVISFALGLRSNGPPIETRDAPGAIETPPRNPVGRVEVLNASGHSGLARAVMNDLRAAGFDVIYFGNAPAPRDSSVVLVRRGSADIARAAARRLDITGVQTQIDTSLYLDATVILGRNYVRR